MSVHTSVHTSVHVPTHMSVHVSIRVSVHMHHTVPAYLMTEHTMTVDDALASRVPF